MTTDNTTTATLAEVCTFVYLNALGALKVKAKGFLIWIERGQDPQQAAANDVEGFRAVQAFYFERGGPEALCAARCRNNRRMDSRELHMAEMLGVTFCDDCSLLFNAGMPVSVYRDSGHGDATNNGITSKFAELVLVGEGGETFPVRDDRPAVKLVRRTINGKAYTHAEPVQRRKSGGAMMGGNFIYSCDSRFRELNAYPVPVHDRQE
jgi:hypothetical protein